MLYLVPDIFVTVGHGDALVLNGHIAYGRSVLCSPEVYLEPVIMTLS